MILTSNNFGALSKTTLKKTQDAISKEMLTLASKPQQNGKQLLTETSTTVSTPRRKRHRAPKKKMEKQA